MAQAPVAGGSASRPPASSGGDTPYAGACSRRVATTRRWVVSGLLAQLDALTAGVDWRSKLKGDPKLGWKNAALAVASHVHDPTTAGNTVDHESETLLTAYRRLSAQLGRAWALASGSATLSEVQRMEARFFEEVRVYIAKLDAEARASRGEPVPEEVRRLLSNLVAESTASGEILDTYAMAGHGPASRGRNRHGRAPSP